MHALQRGLLSLRAIEAVDIDQFPEVARAAVFWVPVQAYYAVHGVGNALLDALDDGQPPMRHTAFLRSIAAKARTYLPDPLGATCKGDPDDGAITIGRSAVSVGAARLASNLSDPSVVGPERLVAKCLLTTHQRTVDARLEDKRSRPRPGRTTRRRLSAAEKIAIADRVGETSVVSFLYRMRCRSNYDDPGIYLHDDAGPELYVQHYNDLLKLTDALVSSFCHVLERRIGTARMNQATANLR